jgi:polyphosphate kinase 2 (PPK2 family)
MPSCAPGALTAPTQFVATEGMKMKINSKDFRAPLGKKIELKHLPTIVKPFCNSKEGYKKLLEEHVAELSSLQNLHYASNRYALLLIFQGMDSTGKDGGDEKRRS